jgi:hypothetical protein
MSNVSGVLPVLRTMFVNVTRLPCDALLIVCPVIVTPVLVVTVNGTELPVISGVGVPVPGS